MPEVARRYREMHYRLRAIGRLSATVVGFHTVLLFHPAAVFGLTQRKDVVMTKQSTRGKKILLISLPLALIVAGVWRWQAMKVMPVVPVAPRTAPTPNAYDYFLDAAAHINYGRDLGYPMDYGDAFAALSAAQREGLLAKNANALQRFREGLRYECQVVPGKHNTVFYADYWSLAHIRQLARLIVFEARVKAARGDAAGSVRARLDLLQLGVNIGHHGDWEPYLTGISYEALARGTKTAAIWDDIDGLDAKAARAAARRMVALCAAQEPLTAVMRTHKSDGQTRLLQLFATTGWRGKMLRKMNRDSRFYVLTASHRTIMRDYTKYMDATIARTKLPYPVRNTLSPLPILKEPALEFANTVLQKASFKDATNTAMNGLLTLALALQAYHQEHAAYPATLAELTPDYLTAIPADPFATDGKLHYRHIGKTYRLYSVGPDCKDNGGISISGKVRAYLTPNTPGDLVAGVDRY